ncbi:hypothetical protein F2Q69_00044261 [Brassica cretica]|uniref:Uncharacterized protein n=1 Tax=Brassica cretica TaxID=69181 RepID=A0A8S9ND91_BRACR|nr:hypothetical protein F2Q69_00044261 [Brassica cretica]
MVDDHASLALAFGSSGRVRAGSFGVRVFSSPKYLDPIAAFPAGKIVMFPAVVAAAVDAVMFPAVVTVASVASTLSGVVVTLVVSMGVLESFVIFL